ncbi:hypothetical protein ACJRO7_031943 [Eucalyptus globulus]|uniref:Secreted protein n=1 Tax=Eucalyptus globulus TaxID=34317 RepID=A0ABD3JI75_EUCGL
MTLARRKRVSSGLSSFSWVRRSVFDFCLSLCTSILAATDSNRKGKFKLATQDKITPHFVLRVSSLREQEVEPSPICERRTSRDDDVANSREEANDQRETKPTSDLGFARSSRG